MAALPESEALFETPVLPATQAEGLTEQARELIACRNLQGLQVLLSEQFREDEFKQMADQLYDVAHRDAFKGVRHFDEALATAFAEAGGNRQPLSVAYLDLDHFKAINDQHGHLAGDTILTTVATAIQAHLRPTDLLARYGGEEFVILLPGLDRAAANTVVKRIRAGVEELASTAASGETILVTLSAGLATYRNDAYGRTAAAELVNAADQALYEAKHQGRNRVVQAE